MKSSYKRIGSYIRHLKVKNTDLKAKELLGINIDKFFMRSVANVVGTDLSKYKVVEKNQFACNRMHVGRDYRIPISCSDKDEPFMVSPAYDVFEIIDTEVLNTDYLMMWFSRKEFDRNAWFYTDADVRGGLPWKAFCDMQLPIPHPDKQRKIVKEYNTIQNRINLNNQLIQKLEETAQALYKHWFVDFEFPNEEGKPYKSSGGKLVYNAELDKDIPEGWLNEPVMNFGVVVTGKTPSSKYPEHFGTEMPFVTPTDFGNYEKYVVGAIRKLSKSGIKNLSKKVLPENSLIVSCIGSDMGKVIVNSESCITNQQINSIIFSNSFMVDFMYNYFKDIYEHLRNIATGSSTMLMINKSEFEVIEVLSPSKQLCKDFHEKLIGLNKRILLNVKESIQMRELKSLILSKMTKVEVDLIKELKCD